MKQILTLLMVALLFVACGNCKKCKDDDKCCDSTKNECCKHPENLVMVDSLLTNQEAFLDKNIAVCGVAIHVCEHSGKNLFIATDTAAEDYLVAKATADLGVFDKALLNEHVCAFGTFKKAEVEAVETHHEKEVYYYLQCDSVKQCKCKEITKNVGDAAKSGCKGHSEKHNCEGQ